MTSRPVELGLTEAALVAMSQTPSAEVINGAWDVQT